MKIVLTNDDGYDSPGIQALRDVLTPEHQVWTIAPDSDRSGSSHCITLKGPVRVREVEKGIMVCSGTPADCVLISSLGALPEKPDMVISGINLGPNLGSDIMLSGTTAGARQGTIMGIPSIAVSITSLSPPFYLEGAASFIKNNLKTFHDLWTQEHFVNINIPNLDRKQLPKQITTLSRPKYKSTLHSFTSPGGEHYYFFRGIPEKVEPEPGTDMHAIMNERISISPIYLLPVLYDHGDTYRPEIFY